MARNTTTTNSNSNSTGNDRSVTFAETLTTTRYFSTNNIICSIPEHMPCTSPIGNTCSRSDIWYDQDVLDAQFSTDLREAVLYGKNIRGMEPFFPGSGDQRTKYIETYAAGVVAKARVFRKVNSIVSNMDTTTQQNSRLLQDRHDEGLRHFARTFSLVSRRLALATAGTDQQAARKVYTEELASLKAEAARRREACLSDTGDAATVGSPERRRFGAMSA